MKDRRRARKLALQALYQWSFNALGEQQLVDQFYQQHQLNVNNPGKVDWELFNHLVLGVVQEFKQLDGLIQPHLTRKTDELDPIERQLLRMACYELLNNPESPTLAIIDDAVHLAKSFGATDGFKLVNAVLDKLVRTIEHRKADLSKPV